LLWGSFFLSNIIIVARLLRYFKRIRAREVTSNELLRVHTFAHVRNYYPLYDKKHLRPIKITSIEALLNYSPPTSPVLLSRQASSNMYKEEENQIKIEKHIKEEEGEQCNTKIDQCQSFHSSVAPPDLVYKMTCGELGIGKKKKGGVIERREIKIKKETLYTNI
jgi:hypothetical protein